MGNENDNQTNATDQATTEPQVDYPSLLDRAKAAMIDAVVFLALFFLTANIFESIGTVGPLTKAIAFCIAFLYDPLLTSLTKGTIGHKMMGLQVVQAGNHENRIWFPMALLRFLFKSFLGGISFLGYLMSTRRRFVHDVLGNSIVLYIPRKKRTKK